MENQPVAERPCSARDTSGSSFPTSKQPEIPSQTPTPTFVGNMNDLIPIISVTAAGISALCCLSWGYLLYCLPVVGIVLGAVALLNAKAAVNPDRTRRWGWVSVGVSGGVLAAMVILALCFVLFYAALIAGSFAAIPMIPTPTRVIR